MIQTTSYLAYDLPRKLSLSRWSILARISACNRLQPNITLLPISGRCGPLANPTKTDSCPRRIATHGHAQPNFLPVHVQLHHVYVSFPCHLLIVMCNIGSEDRMEHPKTLAFGSHFSGTACTNSAKTDLHNMGISSRGPTNTSWATTTYRSNHGAVDPPVLPLTYPRPTEHSNHPSTLTLIYPTESCTCRGSLMMLCSCALQSWLPQLSLIHNRLLLQGGVPELAEFATRVD